MNDIQATAVSPLVYLEVKLKSQFSLESIVRATDQLFRNSGMSKLKFRAIFGPKNVKFGHFSGQ